MADRWEQLANALDALDASLAQVSGDTAIHFYPPLGDAAFADLLDEVQAAGWAVEHTGPHSANVSHGGEGVRVRFVNDEDMMRAQLLKAPDAADAWAWVDGLMGYAGAHVSGAATDWTPPITTDPAAHAEYLSHVLDHARDTWHAIRSYDEAKQKQAGDKLREVVKRGRELAHDAKEKLATTAHDATQAVEKKIDDVSQGFDDLWEDGKSVLGWGALAIGGVAVGWWVVVGVGAYLYLKHGERKAA